MCAEVGHAHHPIGASANRAAVAVVFSIYSPWGRRSGAQRPLSSLIFSSSPCIADYWKYSST